MIRRAIGADPAFGEKFALGVAVSSCRGGRIVYPDWF